MDSKTIQVLLWLPALIIPLVALAWLYSFPKKQRHKHDGDTLGISMMGIAFSLLSWSFWYLKSQIGTDDVKLKVADYVVWAAIIGTVATIFAFAVIYFKSKITTNTSSRRKTKKK